MLLVNGFTAQWKKYNRTDSTSIYDDQNYTISSLKVVPYNASDSIKFGIYTHDEAMGYYMCKGSYDVKVGDKIKITDTRFDVLNQRELTVQEVKNKWLFNKVEVNLLIVK